MIIFNGHKLIKAGQKSLEAFPVGDEIQSILKYFKLMKCCSIVIIAGDSVNVQISYSSCCGMEYLSKPVNLILCTKE